MCPDLWRAHILRLNNFSGDCYNPEVKWNEVKVTLSHLTLCDPMDYIVHGILQVRILEWVAYPFSSRSSWTRNRTRVSCITGRFFTNWAIREAMGGDKCYRQGRVKHDATIFSLGKGLFREYMLERLRAEGLKSGCSLALPLRIFTLNRLLNLSEPQFLYL